MLLGCSMAAKPPVPIAIYKESEGEGADLCIPLMNVQAGQLVWNTRLAHSESAFLQRFVYNGSPCAFIMRVTFQPTLGNLSYQIYENLIPVAQSKHQFAQSLRYSSQETRATIRRKKASVVQLETDSQDCTPSDRFCVTTSAHDTFHVFSWTAIEALKTQVMMVKTVLERGYLSERNLGVLELVVDFSQDKDRKWYFICLHSYKTELVVKKRITSDNLGKLLERLNPIISPSTIRPRSAVAPKRKVHRKSRLHLRLPLSGDSGELSRCSDTEQSLVEDILRDLRTTSVRRTRRKGQQSPGK